MTANQALDVLDAAFKQPTFYLASLAANLSDVWTDQSVFVVVPGCGNGVIELAALDAHLRLMTVRLTAAQ